MQSIIIRVRLAWWLRFFYLPGVVLSAKLILLLGGEPEINQERLNYWIMKGIKISYHYGSIPAIMKA